MLIYAISKLGYWCGAWWVSIPVDGRDGRILNIFLVHGRRENFMLYCFKATKLLGDLIAKLS